MEDEKLVVKPAKTERKKPGRPPKAEKLIDMYHQCGSHIQVKESQVQAHLAAGWTYAP